MPGNTLGTADVPYTNFLGLNTDLAPGDLPEGLSPDCQDVVFRPGEVASRPGLHKLYATIGNATITYIKTYVKADGTPLTLVLDSNGILYKEDVLNNPGILTQIGSVSPGSYCLSVTASNKEFMAFSDGLHGTDIPRQFDGTNFDRVSQDGPGAAITIADVTSTVAITSITPLAAVNIASISQPSGALTGLTIVQTAAPHGLAPGDGFYLFVNNVAPTNGYNAIGAVYTVDSPTQFTYIAPASGLNQVLATGTVRPSTSTLVAASAHDMVVGDAFVVSGSPSNEYNNGAQYNQIDSGQVIESSEQWTVLKVTNPTTFTFRTQSTPAAVALGGTLAPGGFISVGSHKIVCLFLTRQGFLTRPGPSVTWISGGNRKALASNLPIGPSNVIARVLAPTGSGGSNYFWIPADVPGGARATIIPDNTSTTAIVDFADNTLFAATGININGNNLFNLITLGPCLGVFSYGSRLFWWGEVNKVQSFINMGFEGGYLAGAPTVPLGWTIATAGGALVTNPANFGEAWQITGDGTAALKGELQQTAYQDEFKIAIIEPNTNYTFKCWAKASANNLAGSLIATLSSASTAFTSTATIPMNTITTAGKFVSANFSLVMPAVIPSDLTLSIYAQNLPNLATVTIDEMEIIFKAQPYRENDFRVSYVNNLESYDGVTGDLGPQSDPTPIRCCGIIRTRLYIVTADRLHSTQDNGQEPSNWQISQIGDQCGSLSAFCIDGGTSWLTWASDQGLMICEGGAPDKLSQEIQPDWDSINRAAQQRIWLKNDQVTKRIYVGLPTGTNDAPNLIYPLDYRELDSEQEIASHGAIHVTYSGRMSASELSRKWTRWNLTMHCAAIVRRSGNADEFVLGCGNGLAPGSGNGFGNAYYLDPAKLTDDDFGQMFPYYVSYGFVSHDQEQALQVGSHRKLYTFISFFVIGTGTLQIIPYSDVLTNAYPASPQITMSQTQSYDISFPINVDANRAFIKFLPAPLQGTTDVQFKLQQLCLNVGKHPLSPVR